MPIAAVVGLVGLAMAAGRMWGWRDGDAPNRRAIAAYRDGDWGRAEASARSTLKERPLDVGALRLLARASARQGKDRAAEAIYRRLGTEAMEAEDLYLLGEGLLRRGQDGPAMAALGAARDKEPDHAATLDALAGQFEKRRSLSEAMDAADRLVRLPGWEIRGSVRLGRLRSELYDPEGAALDLGRALEGRPDREACGDDPARLGKLLVRCLLRAERPAEALHWLDRLHAGDAETGWLASRAYLQRGRITEADAALDRAGKYGSDDPMLAEPSPFAGARSCKPCHPDQYESQQQSRHARTLLRGGSLASIPWPDGAIVDRHNPVVVHRFRRSGDRVEAETDVEGRAFRAVLEYAMGSNHQGQSFLGHDESGRVYELRMSHYPHEPAWDRTMEHPAEPPDASGYLGRPVSTDSFWRCLHCHATNFRAPGSSDGRPEAADHGIGCERCHGPGGNHERAIAAHFRQAAIARPRLATPARVIALCGECHTAPPSKSPDDAGFVRYQVSGFVLSPCYTVSGESFGCVDCHDPHENAETSPAFYEAKCLDCHAGTGRAPCPVNPRAKCLECHMPKVPDTVPRAIFTDHWIRVRRDARPG